MGREALVRNLGRPRRSVSVHRAEQSELRHLSPPRPSRHCDQTGTGMAMPASLTPRLEGDLRDIDVRISPDVRVEVPREPRARKLPAHQVEQAIWKEARWHRG